MVYICICNEALNKDLRIIFGYITMITLRNGLLRWIIIQIQKLLNQTELCIVELKSVHCTNLYVIDDAI